jgi:hypothetical protein
MIGYGYGYGGGLFYIQGFVLESMTDHRRRMLRKFDWKNKILISTIMFLSKGIIIDMRSSMPSRGSSDLKGLLSAILIIIEGQFQVFQRFSSSKLVLKNRWKPFRGPHWIIMRLAVNLRARFSLSFMRLRLRKRIVGLICVAAALLQVSQSPTAILIIFEGRYNFFFQW